MASPKLLVYADRIKRQHWHGKGYVPSKYSGVTADDLIFRRTQSAKMAVRQWEREEPLWRSWMAAAFIAIFITVILVVLLAV